MGDAYHKSVSVSKPLHDVSAMNSGRRLAGEPPVKQPREPYPDPPPLLEDESVDVVHGALAAIYHLNVPGMNFIWIHINSFSAVVTFTFCNELRQDDGTSTWPAPVGGRTAPSAFGFLGHHNLCLLYIIQALHGKLWKTVLCILQGMHPKYMLRSTYNQQCALSVHWHSEHPACSQCGRLGLTCIFSEHSWIDFWGKIWEQRQLKSVADALFLQGVGSAIDSWMQHKCLETSGTSLVPHLSNYNMKVNEFWILLKRPNLWC